MRMGLIELLLIFIQNRRHIISNNDYFTKLEFLYNLILQIFYKFIVLCLDNLVAMIQNDQRNEFLLFEAFFKLVYLFYDQIFFLQFELEHVLYVFSSIVL